uniref:Uncharacterized protein n=1 Tax=Romanomermis culicivorax TaxID=13658 RepID=A0A915KVE4_ROMCU
MKKENENKKGIEAFFVDILAIYPSGLVIINGIQMDTINYIKAKRSIKITSTEIKATKAYK